MAGTRKATEIAAASNVDWSAFLREGVVVSLTIKRYRGVTTVDFSDLGIAEDAGGDAGFKTFLGEYINLGSKRLLPPSIEGKLKSLESSARQNLQQFGYDCSAFASQGDFVPKANYAEFKKKNDALQKQFFELRDSLKENYEALLTKVRKDYSVLAKNLFIQSHPEGTPVDEEYVKAFTDAIIEQIPSSDEIISSFEYKTRLSYIPEFILAAVDQDESRMYVSPMKDSDDEIVRDIRQSIATQSAEMAADFLEDIQVRFLTGVSEGAENIADSIERHEGKLLGRTSLRTASLLRYARGMGYGDPVLNDYIDAIDVAFNGDSEHVRNVSKLHDIAFELQGWCEGQISRVHAESVARKTEELGKQGSKPNAQADKPAPKTSPTAQKKTASAPAKAQEKPKTAQRSAQAKPASGSKTQSASKPKTSQAPKTQSEAKTSKAPAKSTAADKKHVKKETVSKPATTAKQPRKTASSDSSQKKKKKNVTISVPKKAQPRRNVKKH